MAPITKKKVNFAFELNMGQCIKLVLDVRKEGLETMYYKKFHKKMNFNTFNRTYTNLLQSLDMEKEFFVSEHPIYQPKYDMSTEKTEDEILKSIKPEYTLEDIIKEGLTEQELLKVELENKPKTPGQYTIKDLKRLSSEEKEFILKNI